MFAIAQDDGSSPARHFVFAAILYLGAAILIASVVRRRGSLSWRGGTPASLLTQIFFVLAFLVWGTVSLGLGLNWKLAVEHGDLIDFAVMGGIFLTAAYDRFIHSRFY